MRTIQVYEHAFLPVPTTHTGMSLLLLFVSLTIAPAAFAVLDLVATMF